MNTTCFTIDNEKYPYLFTHTLTNISTVFHYHPFYEFVYVEEGTAINLIGDDKYVLNAGEMSLVVPGENHKIITENCCVRRDICVSSEIFESLYSLLLPDTLIDKSRIFAKAKKFSPSRNAINIFLDKLDHYSVKLNKTDDESRLLAYSLLTEVFCELVPKENIASASTVPPWVKTILLRFDSTKNVQAGLSAITEGINYSHIYINRIFKQYTGVNLRTFLNETRLKLAAMHIHTSDYSAIEISEILGFSSPSFFYKQFKSKYGVTPIEYRTIFNPTVNTKPTAATD